MTNTNEIYSALIQRIMATGDTIPGRNGETQRSFTLPTVIFDSTPLVTVRKTAWKKAIREMEWFLSGSAVCPEELLDWWGGQLDEKGTYRLGYSDQLRHYGKGFDQVTHLIEGMFYYPFTRRHVITTWNPEDMAAITEINDNPLTPATCHTTIAQFFVTKANFVSMHSYQRSADMILGVPHNWIQSWALLLWVAAQVGGIADKLIWTFGDAHIYQEPSHVSTAFKIGTSTSCHHLLLPPRLVYTGNCGDDFYTSDFEMIGNIPDPIIITKPKLL